MKIISLPLLTASLASTLLSQSFAVEGPEDNSPPPNVSSKQRASQLPEIKLQPQVKPTTAAEQTAFLGVVSSEIPAILAEHLDLKPGDGVLVRSLVPNGPAIQAGLCPNDIITRVAGIPVSIPQDVANQITAHKPGDTVTIDLIHKGKPSQLKVTLGTKPEEMASNEPQIIDPLQLDGIPKDMAERILRAVAGNVGGLKLQMNHPNDPLGPEMEEAMRMMKMRMLDAGGQAFLLPDDAASSGHTENTSTIRMNDSSGSIEIKTRNNSKEITIRNAQNKVVWSGPWDTKQDKQAAPPEVRKRIETLDLDRRFQGTGLRVPLNPIEEP